MHIFRLYIKDHKIIYEKYTFNGNAATSPIAKIPGIPVLN
jgi:hypothetical protein